MWDELESLVAALPGIISRRPELDGTGFCLGATSSKRASDPVIHSHTMDFEGSVKKDRRNSDSGLLHPSFVYLFECAGKS